MSEENNNMTISSRKYGGWNRKYLHVLELMGMVRPAYVVNVIRNERSENEGEPVLMRGDSSSAVQCVNT